MAYRFGLNPPVPPPVPAPDPPPKAPPTLALGRYMKKTPYANETKIQHSLTHTNTKLPRSETALCIHLGTSSLVVKRQTTQQHNTVIPTTAAIFTEQVLAKLSGGRESKLDRWLMVDSRKESKAQVTAGRLENESCSYYSVEIPINHFLILFLFVCFHPVSASSYLR